MAEALRPNRFASRSRATARRLGPATGVGPGQASDARVPRAEGQARHCTEAHLTDKAVEYWLKAAVPAYEQSACFEGVAHANSGLALLSDLPNAVERARSELELRSVLGGLLLITRGHTDPDVRATYSRVLTLCERLGETSRRVPALVGLARSFMVQPNFDAAETYGKQLLDLARENGNRAALVASHYALGVSRLHRGDAAGAREHFANGAELHDD